MSNVLDRAEKPSFSHMYDPFVFDLHVSYYLHFSHATCSCVHKVTNSHTDRAITLSLAAHVHTHRIITATTLLPQYTVLWEIWCGLKFTGSTNNKKKIHQFNILTNTV